MKVSPSLYSSKKPVLETVKSIRNTLAEYVHVDVKGSNLLGKVEKDVKIIRDNSDLYVDVHFIEKNPIDCLDTLKRISPDFLAIQYEEMENPSDFYKLSDSLKCVGLSITKKTDFELVKDLIEASSYVLLMTTTPGESGGSFTPENIQWIESFNKRFPGKKVHVDGGIDDIVSEKIRGLDISCVISGSYLMKAKSMTASVLKLKGVKSKTKLQNICTKIENIPSLPIDSSVLEALSAIEKGQRGFCFITGDEKWGIITDGDVRRHLIESKDKSVDLSCTVEKIVNTNPFQIDVNENVEGMLCKLTKEKFDKKLKFVVLVSYNKPVGIVNVEKVLRV